MQAFQVVRLFIEQLEQHSEQMAQRASEQPSDSTGRVLRISTSSLAERDLHVLLRNWSLESLRFCTSLTLVVEVTADTMYMYV